MFFSALTVRHAVAGALGAGAVAGAALFAATPLAPMALAQPVAPNCTAADFSGVASGVSASSSGYLFTHPDVNNFFTSLHGLPPEQIKSKVKDYFNANPQVRDELTAIRQPLVDIKNRCGFTASDSNGPNIP